MASINSNFETKTTAYSEKFPTIIKIPNDTMAKIENRNKKQNQNLHPVCHHNMPHNQQ